MIARAALLAGLLGLVACQAVPEPEPYPWEAALDANFDAWAEETTAPSVVLGVYDHGELVYADAWGLADRDSGAPTDPAVAYEIGSLSKHFTAVAILQQVEAGALRLEDAVGEHVDGLPEAWRGVTIAQLLSHTSGIPDYEAAASYTIYEAPGTPEEIIAVVADMPMDFEPGTDFHYSNTGYYLLCLALESVSGQSTSDYFDEHLFGPAGMSTAGLGHLDNVATAQGYKPEGYVVGAETLVPVPPIYPETTLGAGAVTLTLEDWSAWQKALAAERLLPPEDLQLSYTNATLSSGAEIRYGYGMFVDTRRGAPRLTHSGQTSGYTAWYENYPDTGLSFLALTNRYGGRVGRFGNHVALALMPDLAYANWEPIADAEPSDTKRAHAALRQAARLDDGVDLLSDGLAGALTDPRNVGFVEEIRGFVETLRELTLIGDETTAGARRMIYAGRYDGGVEYWTLNFRDGILVGLNWEDE